MSLGNNWQGPSMATCSWEVTLGCDEKASFDLYSDYLLKMDIPSETPNRETRYNKDRLISQTTLVPCE